MKLHCYICVNWKTVEVDFCLYKTYAVEAIQEINQMILKFAAVHDLIVEREDISNPYLYGDIGTETYIEQLTVSFRHQEFTGAVYKVLDSMHGVKQAVYFSKCHLMISLCL